MTTRYVSVSIQVYKLCEIIDSQYRYRDYTKCVSYSQCGLHETVSTLLDPLILKRLACSLLNISGIPMNVVVIHMQASMYRCTLGSMLVYLRPYYMTVVYQTTIPSYKIQKEMTKIRILNILCTTLHYALKA